MVVMPSPQQPQTQQRQATRPIYYSGTTEPKTPNPDRTFVTVEVEMPHMARYGRPTVMTLVYGATFPVAVGQRVLCPPTRLNPKWSQGTVVALDAGDYKGRVKYLAPMGRRPQKKVR